MSAATIEIPQETQDYIVDQLDRKCSVDTIRQLLELTLRANTPEQAKKMVADVIAAQQPPVIPTLEQLNPLADEPARPEQSTPQTPAEPAQQTADGGNVSAVCERACQTPFDGALHVALKGVPQIPLRPRTKVAFLDTWEQLATTDPTQLNAWHAQYPDANWAGVALAQTSGIWIFEIDNADAVKQRLGSVKLPRTFMVRSRPGRGHYYFRHNAASIALAQIKDHISIKDDQGKEIASARVHHAYCVSPNSIHPETLKPYEIVNDVDLIEAPQVLIDWIKAQHTDDKKLLAVTASSDGPRVPRGSHDNELFRIACKLRADGLEYDEILPVLIRNVEERFDDVGPDWMDMCEKKAQSACRYHKGSNSIPVFHNGVPVGPVPQNGPATATPTVVDSDAEPENIDDSGSHRPARVPSLCHGRNILE